jgi:L-ascorbate metabolism protein UlaG (beta-lactamase superfamily)
LGYHFPEQLEADGVLVSHPHYDHDASYYWTQDVPVFRKPGRYAVDDIQITGIAGRHADPYGKEFGQRNTVWLIESGGVRFVHVGDNGPLAPEAVEALGRVDVLMLPVDDLDHILKRREITAMREALHPRVVVPMHYRLTGLSELPESVGPIDQWLAEQQNVEKLSGSRLAVSARSLPAVSQVVVFQPSAQVKPWSGWLHDAWKLRHSARDLRAADARSEEAIASLRQAASLVPETIVFRVELAEALDAAGRGDEANRILERALAGAGRDDWEYTMRGRNLLARLYRAAGDDSAAALQYRLILEDAYRSEYLEAAREFLRALRGSKP